MGTNRGSTFLANVLAYEAGYGEARRRRASVTHAIERAGLLMMRHTAGVAATLGLTMSEQATLVFIATADGAGAGLVQAHIADATSSSPSAMTARIDRLEARGLVERIPDPRDRRASLVRLTGAGGELVRRLLDTVDAAQAPLLDGFTEAEQEAFAELLRRVIASVEEQPAGE